MKLEFNDAKRSIIIMADPNEREKLKDFFPKEYLENSKVVKVREFVDRFMVPTGETYLEIKGAAKK